MECHRCRHSVDVNDGNWANVPYEQTPCANCQMDEEPRMSFTGEEWQLSIDEERNVGAMRHGVSGMPVTVMQELVAGLLSLPPLTRDILCWRYMGYKYTEIAELMGVTKSAVEVRHRRALKDVPFLGSLFPLKTARSEERARNERAAVAAGGEGDTGVVTRHKGKKTTAAERD